MPAQAGAGLQALRRRRAVRPSGTGASTPVFVDLGMSGSLEQSVSSGLGPLPAELTGLLPWLLFKR